MFRFSQLAVLSVLSVLLSACGFGDSSSKNKQEAALEVDSLAVVSPAPVETLYGFVKDDFEIKEGKVEKGQTFGQILQKHHIGYPQIHHIVEASKEVYDIRRIRPGKKYTMLCGKDSLNKAQVMIYQPTLVDYIIFDFQDSIKVSRGKKDVVLKEKRVSGKIKSSLSAALDEQGANFLLANEMSEIYAWTIDFFRLQKGDEFKVVYEEKYIDDSVFVGLDKIKYAEFTHQGEPYYAFYFEPEGEFPEYYDEEGRNLRKAFLKAPVKFSRISSRYGKRYHPVLHRWKSHLGTDYAAPRGTEIYSTANGTVERAGYTKNNGNFVKVRHNGTYSTQYLHMHKIRSGIRPGVKVKQGEVIGFVGSTGLATGPHVCYRFWKNGRQVDALREKLPDAEPIKEEYKTAFFEFMTPLRSNLDQMKVLAPERKDLLAKFFTPADTSVYSVKAL